MLVTVEMRVRTIRILVGSLASRPSGVRLPIASPAIHAPNASRNRSGSFAHTVHIFVRHTMRNGAEQEDDHEPPADPGDAVDDRRPAADALHGEDQQRDPDDGDHRVQE